jgi:hypothetical protein
MTDQTVELLPAFMWVCDSCGRDNFERCRRVDPESIEGTELFAEVAAENAELAEDLGESLTVGGEFLAAPQRVKCGHCGAEYATEIDGDRQ